MESQAREAVSRARRLSAPAATKAMYAIPKKAVQHALKRRKMVSERYRDDGYPVLVKWSIRYAVTPTSVSAITVRREYMQGSIFSV